MKKLKQTLGPSNFSGSGQKVGGADAGSSTGPAPRSRPEVMASKVANTVSSPAPNTGGDTKTSTSTKPTDTREEMRKRAADAQTVGVLPACPPISIYLQTPSPLTVYLESHPGPAYRQRPDQLHSGRPANRTRGTEEQWQVSHHARPRGERDQQQAPRDR